MVLNLIIVFHLSSLIFMEHHQPYLPYPVWISRKISKNSHIPLQNCISCDAPVDSKCIYKPYRHAIWKQKMPNADCCH